MEKNYTEIYLIVDVSGSMSSIRTDAEGGLNELIKEQRKLPGRCKVSLVKFSNEPMVQFEAVDIKNVGPIEIVPTNNTALNDAVGITINRLGDRLKNMSEKNRPEHVIVAICTDGFENASKEFTGQQIADMIKHQSNKYNWEFIYIGCGKESLEVAKKMNIKFDNAMAYTHDSHGTKSAYTSTSLKMRSIRSNTYHDMSKDTNAR